MSKTKTKKAPAVETLGRSLTKERPSVDLTLPVGVKDLAMALRMAMATGNGDIDGVAHDLEVSMSMNGVAVLVQITPETKGGAPPFWRTYAFTANELLNAAWTHYRNNPPTDAERNGGE